MGKCWSLLIFSTSVLAACAPPGGLERAPSLLPAPVGPFGVARITYHWVDSSRAEEFAEMADARRELMVDVWYPTDRRPRRAADYLPNLPVLRRTLDEAQLAKEFAPVYSKL